MTNRSDNHLFNNQSAAANEARFRALVAATSDIIYSMSADWRVMQQLDGRGFLPDTAGPITDWLPKYVAVEDQVKVQTAIDHAIAEKRIFELEHRVLQSDGTIGWTFSRAVPILNDQGEIIEWFGTATDITERKRIADELREAQDRSEQQRRLYETITSSTPDLIYVFDLQYRFTYANNALLTMWGKTWDTAVGKGLLENGYEPWHAEMHEREIDQIVATKQPFRGEVSFPHAILGKRVYDYILTPVLNDQGQVEAVAGTTRDVTERKQWEEALAQSSEELQAINEEMIAINEEQVASNEELSATNEELAEVNQQLIEAQKDTYLATKQVEGAEERLRLAIDAAQLGSFSMSSTEDAYISSPRVKEFFGFTADETVPYQMAINQIHPDYRETVIRLVAESFETGKRFDMEYPVIGYHDGKTRWIRGVGTMQHDSDGKNYFTGVLNDITERKQDEQRKNDFIAMVSHELKTPLTSLAGILQLLTRKIGEAANSALPGGIDRAHLQVKKMITLINGFLNVSRLESGKIQLDKETFDLTALLSELLEEAALLGSDHRISIAPCPPVSILADKDKIGSVVSNLLSNAIKYSPKGKEIMIRCNTDDKYVYVSVKDSGMGIKAQNIDFLFDRYYRVETNHTQNIAGFGIGLYLSAEIVKHHGGEIGVESESGVGSTFWFKLPKSPAASLSSVDQ
ncbi:PAS domain S-box protein [Pedobacter sp. MC2016-24]|uniref:PAS domain S-box protein n=1 Tax=Pedobacter sp. MC2016-24 TaxID=2780090 RepID=UPI00187E766D|nr:PAS domain S-box protein [Pedobacter sp. MC2016-24]MBE9602342.1 PAS domain S-box protein [Pedobacter sp. MC2016-24]